jgi:hypothetical protein
MNWMPSNVGAEPKKLAILGALLAAAGGVYWINSGPNTAAPTAPTVTAPGKAAPVVPSVPAVPQRTPASASKSLATRGNERSIQDFRPTLKLPEGFDISRVDPALRLDLLAKVQNVDASGGSRSLFEFSQPPAPPPPKVKPIVPGPVVPPPEPPKPPAQTTSTEPPKPALAPIPLKFYGYAGTTRGGSRRAFFLDGEDIFVAAENELIRNRYKIVRIGVNSAVVEDTMNQNQQTLPLAEEAGA